MAAAGDPTEDAGYARKLDRTPEHSESSIARMSQGDRNRIYGLRAAFETARDRMERLEDEVDTRERDLNKEMEMRKLLEEKLQSHLVDIYSSPGVNEELHQRLPKSANRKTGRRRQRSRRRRHSAGSERCSVASGSESGKRDPSPSKRTRHRHRSLSTENSGISDGEGPTHRFRRRHQNSSHGPNPFYSTPNNGYYGYPAPPMFYPHPHFNEAASAMHDQTTQPRVPTVDSTTQRNFTNAAGGDFNGTQTRHTLTPGIGGYVAGGVSSEKGIHGVVGGKEGLSGGGMTERVTESTARDQTSQLKMLLQELDHYKDQNRQLAEELVGTQKEVERLTMKSQLASVDVEAEAAARVAALINEVYSAQKQRDEAVMGRVRLANTERDEALERLKSALAHQHHRWDYSVEDSKAEIHQESNQSSRMADLLQGMSDSAVSPSKIRHETSSIVDIIHGRIVHRNKGHVEEVQAVLEERDTALEKCKQFQEEILSLQRAALERSSSGPSESSLKKKLSATQQERDLALSRQSKLEEELQTLRVYYSLHKSLSQETMLRDQYNNSLDRMEHALAEKDGWVQTTQSVNNRLTVQLKGLASEREVMKADLDKVQNSNREVSARAEKYQRQVAVLQRKLKSLNTNSPTQHII